MNVTSTPVILGWTTITAILSLVVVHEAYSPGGPAPHEVRGIWLVAAFCACGWLAPPAPHYLWALPTAIAIAAAIATTRAARRHRDAA